MEDMRLKLDDRELEFWQAAYVTVVANWIETKDATPLQSKLKRAGVIADEMLKEFQSR